MVNTENNIDQIKGNEPVNPIATAQINTSTNVVTDTKKRFKLPILKKPSKKLTILLVLLCIILGILIYQQLTKPAYSTPLPPDNTEVLEREKTTSQAAETAYRERVAQPLPKTATIDQKNQYYLDSLIVKMMDGDSAQTAIYYIQEVKPKNIAISLDIKEGLVSVMIKTEYKQETKSLLQEIITEYQKKSQETIDENLKKYAEAKITYYQELEKGL